MASPGGCGGDNGDSSSHQVTGDLSVGDLKTRNGNSNTGTVVGDCVVAGDGGKSHATAGVVGDGGGKGRSPDGSPIIRLLVLGGPGVGKSAITVRYLTRRFIGEYKSQVDIIYRQSLRVNGAKVDLEIIDISSRPGDDALPTLEICQCDCYLVVYSVADRHTFLTANQLLHAIFKLRPHLPCPPITLLGNKQDLEHSRQVTHEEGRTISNLFGCAFAEVSVAETSEDIVPVFDSLIRRARASACLCPRLPEGPLLTPGTCSCSCHHTQPIDGCTCRFCDCSEKKLSACVPTERRASPSSQSVGKENGSVGMSDSEAACGVTKRDSHRTHVGRSSSKRQAVRSLSSPLHTSENVCSVTSVNHDSDKETSSPQASRTPAGVDKKHEDPPKQLKDDVEKAKTLKQLDPGPVHGTALCRSLSSPEAWPERQSCVDDSPSKTKAGSVKSSKAEGFFSSLKSQEPGMSLLSRGRSFMLDMRKPERNSWCSCRVRTRNRSFKSSGKVEIVNIKKNDSKISRKGEGNRPEVTVGGALQRSKSPPEFSWVRIPKRDYANTPPHSPEENQSQISFFSLSSASRTPRLPKRLPLDPLEAGAVDDSCPSPTGGRQRKFSVFGVGRALGNFLSKGSLPDLPRATANICDKFGSLKRTIKKRSV
ncbi:uncharacterized protein [Panulirus ornatus]